MTTTRYISKCRACGCFTSALSEGQDARRTKDEVPAGAAYTHTGAWVPGVTLGGIVIDCRKCGQPRNALAVRGRFSAKHQCSARCLSSTGTTCECSCAGKNHGAGHAG